VDKKEGTIENETADHVKRSGNNNKNRRRRRRRNKSMDW